MKHLTDKSIIANSPAGSHTGGAVPCLRFLKTQWQLLLGIALIIILTLMLILAHTNSTSNASTSGYKQQSAQNNSVANFKMNDSVPVDNINGYYLKNNKLLSFDITTNSNNKIVTITALNTSDASGYTNKRNTHFYDVCDLITKQGITPDNNFIGINYTVVNANNEPQLSFKLDSNMMLDILDGEITYKTLYLYVQDLYMTKEFQ